MPTTLHSSGSALGDSPLDHFTAGTCNTEHEDRASVQFVKTIVCLRLSLGHGTMHISQDPH